jgi:hypothetical protein
MIELDANASNVWTEPGFDDPGSFTLLTHRLSRLFEQVKIKKRPLEGVFCFKRDHGSLPCKLAFKASQTFKVF